MLRGAGHEVTEAANGDDALARFAAARPELAIVDLILPGKDGLWTIRTLRLLDPRIRMLAIAGGGTLFHVDGQAIAEAL